MLHEDPYTPSESRYECRDCLERIASDERLERCPECGGRMHNVAVPRE